MPQPDQGKFGNCPGGSSVVHQIPAPLCFATALLQPCRSVLLLADCAEAVEGGSGQQAR